MKHLPNGTVSVGAPGSKMRVIAEQMDALVVIHRIYTYPDGQIEHYFPPDVLTLEYWLNALDEFSDSQPSCYESNANAQITAFYQRNPEILKKAALEQAVQLFVEMLGGAQ